MWCLLYREQFLIQSCGSTGFTVTLVTKRNVTYSVLWSDSEINLGIHLFGGLLRFNQRHSARRRERERLGTLLMSKTYCPCQVLTITLFLCYLFVCLLFCVFCYLYRSHMLLYFLIACPGNQGDRNLVMNWQLDGLMRTNIFRCEFCCLSVLLWFIDSCVLPKFNLKRSGFRSLQSAQIVVCQHSYGFACISRGR